MSEKTQNKVEDGAEEIAERADEHSTNMTDQTKTLPLEEQGSSPQDEQQIDPQLDRTTNNLLSEQNINAPPTKETSLQDTVGSGPAQQLGLDESPAQDQKGDPSPNQDPKSTEEYVLSSPLTHGSEKQPPRNQNPESTEDPSTPQHISPGDPTQEQNAGQKTTQQDNPQETQEQDLQKKDETSPQPTETDPIHDDDSTSYPRETDPLRIEETGSQENKIKDNDQKNGVLKSTNAESSTPEEEAVPKSDDNDGRKVDEPNDKNDKSKLKHITNDTSTNPKCDIKPEESNDESSKVSHKFDPTTNETQVETPDTVNDEAADKQNYETPTSPISEPPSDPNPVTSNEPTSEFPNDQSDETPDASNPTFELKNEKREPNNVDKTDSNPDESFVPADTTDQEEEGQKKQTRPDHQERGEENEIKAFQELTEQMGQVVFIETPAHPAIRDLLRNCQSYEKEFGMAGNLKGAIDEYEYLLKKAKETGCKKQKSNPPPSELSFVNDVERNQAPLLYAVIADVSKKVPNYTRWREAVSEFISLTTLCQPEPQTSKKKRTKSQSGFQSKPPVKPPKSYNNNIEKLLDRDWESDRFPGPSVFNDYRHLFTCESVLKSAFPEADIFGLVDCTIRGPEDVPQELTHKALFHFLLSINPKKYGVEPSDAWRDFGKLVLSEKQLELAKKAQGPDLHQNIIVKRLDFYKMQNELKEKTEEVEELSTRLSKFASQQLTEGNPNIADLSDTHRPTRLGEMYSQLFDDEWSEAFEAFKPKTEDEDDDIFPDTLYILQDLLTNIFDFCKDQSKSQKIYLEDSFALAIGLTEPQVLKKEDTATENKFDCKDAPKLDEKEQTGSVGDTGSSPEKNIEEGQVKEQHRETDGEGESSEQPPVIENENVEKETPNKLETDKPGEETNKDTGSNNMQETLSHATQPEIGGESSKTLETDEGNTIPPTGKTENGMDKLVKDEKQDENSKECPKADDGNDVDKVDESANLDKNKEEQSTGDNENNNGDQEVKNREQRDQNQQTSKDTVGEEPSNQTPNEKRQEVLEEGKTDTDKSDSSQKDQAQEPGKEDKQPESKDYRKSVIYPTIDRHARDFRKAAASTSAKTKSKLFIATELPALIAEETVRADVRVLTYVRKCVELCWYMCMQDPPMVIVSPKQGQLVDKTLFSFHGRRGKIVEVCVWPALLLHDNGPLVCKGYVLPEERNRNK